MRRRTVATVVGLGLIMAGCGAEPSGSPSLKPPMPAASAAVTSDFLSFDDAEALAMSEPVRFRGQGGVRLDGRVFGSGDVGVVLAHMRPGDQSQWLGFAALLAIAGTSC